MAIIPLRLTWMYQANEEILETAYEYFADEVVEADTAQLICDDLANWAWGKRTNFAAILATDCKIWGVSASSPNFLGAGPARRTRAMAVPGTATGSSATDQCTFRIFQHAHNGLSKPIRNSCEISGMPTSAIDCALITSAWVAIVNGQLDNIMPLTIGLSSALVTLAVRNELGGGDPVYYPCESRNCGDIVGSNITRRGNRPQG